MPPKGHSTSVVLMREEAQAVLREMSGVPKLMASLLYGSGLRLLECAQLRVKDFDLAAGHIVVRQGKGKKDRLTLLPDQLRQPLREHLSDVERQHERNLAHGAGHVELPGALAAKYPNAARGWPWQWAFPATRQYRHPSSGLLYRHHVHETVLQKAFRAATKRGSRNRRRATACGTASPRRCSRLVTTFARSRSCSGTVTSRRR